PDVPGQPHQVTSAVSFSATAGTVYRIAVDGYDNDDNGGDMGPLTLNWTESNCTEPPPTVISEQGTNNAAILNAVTFVRGPFTVIDNYKFSADRRTRVVFFTSNLGLTQPDSVLSVQAAGMALPVEAVGPIVTAGLDASYVVVRLSDGLPAGDWP